MAIKDFNYQEFAQNLTSQAHELVPQDFSDFEKKYVVNTLLNFSTLAGESLYNDTEANFNAEQAMMITQIIAEWSFHKSVDLIRAKIPHEFWDSIMQKIAFVIFDIAKRTFMQGMPQDQILQLIEHHVKKTYVESIEDLRNKGFIDQELMEVASNQSNIDAMINQAEEEQQMQQDASYGNVPQGQGSYNQAGVQQPSTSSKIMKLATVALLFKRMKQDKVQTMLNKFSPDDAQTVIKYMNMPDLADRVSVNTALKCLNEIKMSLPAPQEISPSKIVARLQTVTQDKDKKQLETILRLERINVKRLVFNALDGEYYNLPPKVANIIATHMEDSV